MWQCDISIVSRIEKFGSSGNVGQHVHGWSGSVAPHCGHFPHEFKVCSVTERYQTCVAFLAIA